MEKTKSDYSSVPSYEQARDEAGITNEVGLSDLLGQEIVIKGWTPDSRVLPQTKQRTQGFKVEGMFVKTEDDFTVFIGAVKLVNELTALVPPFRTVIRESGQTYRFS